MTPTTKEAQRAELHRTIWQIANDLRGSVDGWDFKSYVLGMLFYRFISEDLTIYVNKGEHEKGYTDFADEQVTNEIYNDLVKEKGFCILPSELFQNVRSQAHSDENLNETLERAFIKIEGSATGTDSERNMKGLFDDLDVNSPKLGSTVLKRNEKLVKLLNAIGSLQLGDFKDNAIDLFGDAYARRFMQAAFRSGSLQTTGTAIKDVLPPISRFNTDEGYSYSEKKQHVIAKLVALFERFFGLRAKNES